MEAEKKLRGAIYRLQRMEELYSKDDESFFYEFEDFLVRVRSVPDVLLEDFNKKFSLGISLEEKLYPQTFENRACQLGNTKAIDFIQFWKSEMKQIRCDRIGSMLLEKRDFAVHRGVVKPDLKKIEICETARGTESITLRKYDEKGNLIEEMKIPEIPLEPIEPKPPEMKWFFEEYPDEDVLEISKKFLQMVKRFIEKAKSQFN